MADVILTMSRFDLARAFYSKLLPEFGMKPVYDGDKFLCRHCTCPRKVAVGGFRHLHGFLVPHYVRQHVQTEF